MLGKEYPKGGERSGWRNVDRVSTEVDNVLSVTPIVSNANAVQIEDNIRVQNSDIETSCKIDENERTILK
jgi:hypothetical protein